MSGVGSTSAMVALPVQAEVPRLVSLSSNRQELPALHGPNWVFSMPACGGCTGGGGGGATGAVGVAGTSSSCSSWGGGAGVTGGAWTIGTHC